MTHKRQTGFTLIELMIVVAVVGILAAIAYPSYSESVLKGKRAQGRTALAELMQQQERYMTQMNCYLAFTTAFSGGVATATAVAGVAPCGAAPNSVPFKIASGDNAAPAYYLSAGSCPAASGVVLALTECVQLTATPVGTDGRVGTLSITSAGSKTCTPPSGGTQPPQAVCWP